MNEFMELAVKEAEGGIENVVLLSRHFFVAQTGLEQAAGRSTAQILSYQRIESVAAESFLCQKYMGAGSLHHSIEN